MYKLCFFSNENIICVKETNLFIEKYKRKSFWKNGTGKLKK